VRLLRWCQPVSRHHPVGVYQGEEAKIADLEGSLPAHVVEAVIGPAVDRGRLVAVMTEEWQTAGFTQLLSDELLWRGRDFGTVHEMKEAARRWCRGVSAARQHGTLPGTVGEVFASIERPALRELPEQPFEIAGTGGARPRRRAAQRAAPVGLPAPGA
jgi:hypothetical protein